MPTKCFLVHPIAKRRQWLRRFTFSDRGSVCPASKWGHDAETRIEDAVVPVPAPREYESGSEWDRLTTKSDLRWPVKCAKCDYRFVDGDEWQLFSWRVYADDSGAEFIPHPNHAVPGMMWWADWLHHDGQCIYWDNCTSPHLYVVLPGGHEWDVMSRASNCTKKEDRLHRCWVLEGSAPNFSVSKNGLTCSAGAGSIMAGNYHGFLRNGFLT